MPNKSPISGGSEDYNRYIRVLLADEDPHLQPLIQEELPSHVAPEPLSVGNEELTRRLAEKAQVGESSSEFQVIIHAVNDFSIARKEAKKREAVIFSVEPPPPSYLTPVETKADMAKSTLLRYSMRPIKEVIQLAKVFKTIGIRDLVALEPKREVLHQIAVIIVSRYKAPQDAELDQFLASTAPEHRKKFLQANPDFIQNVDLFRAKIAEEVSAYLGGAMREFDNDIKELVKKVRAQVSEDHDLSDDEVRAAITNRVVDLATTAYVTEIVKDHCAGKITLEELPKRSKNERRCFMVNGGVASGKGSAISLMRKQAKEGGVDLSDALVINTDSFKLMLLDPAELDGDEKPFYSVLTHDEASVIRAKVMSTYRSLLDQDHAPHLFVDQVYTGNDIVDMMAGSDQAGLDVTLVQISVGDSFKMSFSRGEATGRFENRGTVIGTHKRVPDQLLATLRFAIEHKKVNMRIRIVKNTGPGQTAPVGFFDLQKKEGEISDLEALRAFFEKTQLNPNARTFDELYSLGVDGEAVEKKVSEFTSYFEVAT